jgi:OOP family OmpA-OmpF porin
MNSARSTLRGALTPLFLASALCGALLLAPTSAHAYTPEYELGVFGGAHLWNPDNGLGRQDALIQYNHGAEFGVRLGLGLHKRFMLEAELAVAPSGITDNRPQSVTAAGMMINPTQALGIGYRIHGLINLMTGRVRPFLLLGGGGLTVSSSNPNVIVSDTTGSLDLGAGLKVDVTYNWGLRLEGRAVLVPGGPDATHLVPDGEVLLGVMGFFGDRRGGVAPPADDDHDGLPNSQDQCPTVAGPKENKGCPLDADDDGVPDTQDKCPKVKGLPQFKGCPNEESLDSDGDGIPDYKDKCPDAAENKNGYQDDDGCPDTPPPPTVLQYIGTIPGVKFEPEKTELTPASLTVLDGAAAVLRDNPTVKLEIAGYTDNSGDAARNQDLSQKRAEAVKTYLASKGIDPTRLTAKGYGQDTPLADNATAEGREKNRRIEFHYINP